MNVVEVKGLSKAFNQNKVLDNVDFQIKQGTFTALLGKNGSGKSTILNILMGHELLDQGECKLFGESLNDNPDHLKNKIGHVSERIRFDYPLTMKVFIADYSKMFDKFDLKQFYRQAGEVKINLDKQFGEYSRGQKMQIVMLAALAQNPELLLIDEITSVLDAYSRNYFISLLKNYTAQGGTVILTTNIVNEVQYYCSDVLFLSKNKIKFQTALADIPSNFKKVRSTTPEHPLLKLPECIWSGINSDGSNSYILPNGSYNASSLLGLMEDKRAVTLEDLYIYYSQRDQNE
ncbi:MAG: ABC transporter ATP-binding protein [Bdellovibrionales bacterium]|nr:ABC transporter ATP-binding protein [Bdellovibrionales bacterium]